MAMMGKMSQEERLQAAMVVAGVVEITDAGKRATASHYNECG